MAIAIIRRTSSIRAYFEEMGKQLKFISKPEGKGGQDVTAAYLYDLSMIK